MQTCKGCDFCNIVEPPIALAIEAGPQVCNEDLCTLVEAHFLALEFYLISKAGEVFHYQVHQCSSRTSGFFDTSREATLETLF